MLHKFVKKVALGAFILGTVFTTSMVATSQEAAAADFSGKASMSLNVRRGPGMQYGSMGAVNEGAIVSGPVVNGWVQVSYNGQTGYVSKYYLSGSKGKKSDSSSSKSKSQGKERKSNAPSGRTKTMEATAYHEDGSMRTASGTWPKYGTIAVDPRVIPLGTKVYVEGYGYATAEDTGGAIKGNIIDVYLNSNSEVYHWGRKSVQVTILD